MAEDDDSEDDSGARFLRKLKINLIVQSLLSHFSETKVGKVNVEKDIYFFIQLKIISFDGWQFFIATNVTCVHMYLNLQMEGKIEWIGYCDVEF